MVMIKEEHLEEGLKIVRIASTCLRSPHCLWGKKEDIPESCKGKICEVIEFRRIFESDSPAFYGKVLEFSDYQRKVYNFQRLEMENGPLKQKRKAQMELHDLYIFAQLFLLIFYPLYLANKEVPFLTPSEIRKEEKKFFSQPTNRSVNNIYQKMAEINQEWFEWIQISLTNFLFPEHYTNSIALLVQMFLAGSEKTQLPPLSEMSEREKEEFFQHLEKELFSNKKG